MVEDKQAVGTTNLEMGDFKIFEKKMSKEKQPLLDIKALKKLFNEFIKDEQDKLQNCVQKNFQDNINNTIKSVDSDLSRFENFNETELTKLIRKVKYLNMMNILDNKNLKMNFGMEEITKKMNQKLQNLYEKLINKDFWLQMLQNKSVVNLVIEDRNVNTFNKYVLLYSTSKKFLEENWSDENFKQLCRQIVNKLCQRSNELVNKLNSQFENDKKLKNHQEILNSLAFIRNLQWIDSLTNNKLIENKINNIIEKLVDIFQELEQEMYKHIQQIEGKNFSQFQINKTMKLTKLIYDHMNQFDQVTFKQIQNNYHQIKQNLEKVLKKKYIYYQNVIEICQTNTGDKLWIKFHESISLIIKFKDLEFQYFWGQNLPKELHFELLYQEFNFFIQEIVDSWLKQSQNLIIERNFVDTLQKVSNIPDNIQKLEISLKRFEQFANSNYEIENISSENNLIVKITQAEKNRNEFVQNFKDFLKYHETRLKEKSDPQELMKNEQIIKNCQKLLDKNIPELKTTGIQNFKEVQQEVIKEFISLIKRQEILQALQQVDTVKKFSNSVEQKLLIQQCLLKANELMVYQQEKCLSDYIKSQDEQIMNLYEKNLKDLSQIYNYLIKLQENFDQKKYQKFFYDEKFSNHFNENFILQMENQIKSLDYFQVFKLSEKGMQLLKHQKGIEQNYQNIQLIKSNINIQTNLESKINIIKNKILDIGIDLAQEQSKYYKNLYKQIQQLNHIDIYSEKGQQFVSKTINSIRNTFDLRLKDKYNNYLVKYKQQSQIEKKIQEDDENLKYIAKELNIYQNYKKVQQIIVEKFYNTEEKINLCIQNQENGEQLVELVSQFDKNIEKTKEVKDSCIEVMKQNKIDVISNLNSNKYEEVIKQWDKIYFFDPIVKKYPILQNEYIKQKDEIIKQTDQILQKKSDTVNESIYYVQQTFKIPLNDKIMGDLKKNQIQKIQNLSFLINIVGLFQLKQIQESSVKDFCFSLKSNLQYLLDFLLNFKNNFDKKLTNEIQEIDEELKKYNVLQDLIKDMKNNQYFRQIELSKPKIKGFLDEVYLEIQKIQPFINQILNYNEAETNVILKIKQLSKDIFQSYKEEIYKETKKIIQLKELSKRDKNREMEFDSLVQEMDQDMLQRVTTITNCFKDGKYKDSEKQYKFIKKCDQDFIQEIKFNVFSKNYLIEANNNITSILKQTMSSIKKLNLQDTSSQIIQDNSKDIATKICQIYSIYIVHNAADFKPFLEQQINEILSHLQSQNKAYINEINNNLSEMEGADQKIVDTGKIVIQKFPAFKSYNIENYKKKISQFKFDEIIIKFKKTIEGKDQNIDQQLIRKKYDLFNRIYDDKLNYYYNTNQIKQKDNLKKEVNEKLKKLKFKELNSLYKQEIIEIFALISASWSLLEIQVQQIIDQVSYIKPNNVQIIAIIFLLGCDTSKNQQFFDNQLIQILTGEGKSIIMGFLSLLLALLKFEVHSVCYSKYLSERDYKDFMPLFSYYQVEQNITYGTFQQMSEIILQKQFDIREETLKLIDKNFKIQKSKNQVELDKKRIANQQRETILIIDEVDTFFSKSFYGKTFNPVAQYQNNDIIEVIKYIWKYGKIRNGKKITTDPQQLLNDVQQTSFYKNLNLLFPQWIQVFKTQFWEMIQSIDLIEKKAYYPYDYNSKIKKIGYKMEDHSISYDVTYKYVTMFQYYLQHEIDQYSLDESELNNKLLLSIACGYLSYAETPKKQYYQTIFGVTGTLSTLHEEMKINLNHYKINHLTYAPSIFLKSNCQFFQNDSQYFNIYDDDVQQEKQIVTLTNMKVNQGQSVIIVCDDKQKSLKLEKEFKQTLNNNEVQLIDETTENKELAIMKATQSKKISIAIREYGRGTDFKCNDTKVSNISIMTGLVIIQTFFSLDYSEEIQIKGRTARQGEYGYYHLFVTKKDLEQYDIAISQNIINQNKAYDELHIQRNKKFGKEIKNYQKGITEAKKKFDETNQYLENLKNKNINTSIDYIIKINSIPFQKSKQRADFHFILALDGSGSMTSFDNEGLSRWDRMIKACKDLFDQAQDNDLISIIVYHSSSQIIHQSQKMKGFYPQVLALNFPQGGTIFDIALNDMSLVLQNSLQSNIQCILCFLSDGQSSFKNDSLDQIFTSKQKISFFKFIGFGPGSDTGTLKQMSDYCNQNGVKSDQNLAVGGQQLQQVFQALGKIEVQNI